MNILITCPRAPVTIEWIKIAQRSACHITLVDSLDYPIGRYYDTRISYVKVASPAIDFPAYRQAMLTLLAETDIVIPNCEDIFYLAQLKKEAPVHVQFFMPEPTLLFQCHNKFAFFDLLNNQVKKPVTRLIHSLDQIEDNDNSILKPVFSRFGRNVIRGVEKNKLSHLTISTKYPWVQQEFIHGQALCNYAVCLHGEVIAHAVYKPQYLLNQAAATYFEITPNAHITQFAADFARDNHYSGQVAFDFIDDGKDIYVLECNPRATSGLHLVADNLHINHAGIHSNNHTLSKQACRVGLSLFVMFGFKALCRGEFYALYKDHNRAKDVLAGLPAYAQFLSFYEMCSRAIRFKKPLTHSTTFDIEYDGENPQ